MCTYREKYMNVYEYINAHNVLKYLKISSKYTKTSIKILLLLLFPSACGSMGRALAFRENSSVALLLSSPLPSTQAPRRKLSSQTYTAWTLAQT